MGSLWRDVRQAARALRRAPVLALVVVASLGAGIGANATVFSWIQTIVFDPMPGVVASGSFHFVEPTTATGDAPGSSWMEYGDLSSRLTSFRGLAVSRMAPLFVGEPGRTERTYAQLVSGNFFDVLGVRPETGRVLQLADAARPGGDPVAVISFDYWQTHFGGAADVLQQTIRANDVTLSIVGVTARDFQGSILGLSFDVWVPATLAPVLYPGSTELTDRAQRSYSIMGRLQPGVTAAQAQREAAAAMQELARAYPATNAKMSAEVLNYFNAQRGPQRFFASALWFLQGVMLLLLLTVCGNTANLVLSRASVRQREVGVRLALGARPWRIASALLLENVLLGLAGAGVGIVLAMWGTEALRAVPMTGAFPVKFQTHIDLATIAFAAALGALSGVIFGLPPAVWLAQCEPMSALRSGSREAGRSGLRHMLMGAQVTLAMLVLIAAGLFYKSYAESREINPGFRTDGVLLAAYDLTGRLTPGNVDQGKTIRTFVSRLLARLREVPTIESAAISSNMPLDIHGLPLRTFTVEGAPRADGKPDECLSNIVTPGYFDTLGLKVLEGADFVSFDDVVTAPQVVVNDVFVRKYLAGQAPIGRRIDSRGRLYTIAGVVAASTYNAFGEAPTAIMYFSYRDRVPSGGEIHVRARPGLEDALAEKVRTIVRELDPELPLYNVRSMTEHIDRNLVLRKIPARMFVVLGPLLLALAAIGIYAVVAYAVSQRTKEISVRIVLGATAGRLVRGIVADSLRPVWIGAAFGWLLAVLVDLHLVGGGRKDLPVIVGVPIVLLSVAVLACWLPARRAAAVQPIRALREQ